MSLIINRNPYITAYLLKQESLATIYTTCKMQLLMGVDTLFALLRSVRLQLNEKDATKGNYIIKFNVLAHLHHNNGIRFIKHTITYIFLKRVI